MGESVQIVPLARDGHGPSVMTSVFLVTSRNPVRNSLVYVGSVALAVAAGTLIAFGLSNLIGVGAQGEEGGKSTFTYVIAGLLAILIIDTYLRRDKLGRPSGWANFRRLMRDWQAGSGSC